MGSLRGASIRAPRMTVLSRQTVLAMLGIALGALLAGIPFVALANATPSFVVTPARVDACRDAITRHRPGEGRERRSPTQTYTRNSHVHE